MKRKFQAPLLGKPPAEAAGGTAGDGGAGRPTPIPAPGPKAPFKIPALSHLKKPAPPSAAAAAGGGTRQTSGNAAADHQPDAHAVPGPPATTQLQPPAPKEPAAPRPAGGLQRPTPKQTGSSREAGKAAKLPEAAAAGPVPEEAPSALASLQPPPAAPAAASAPVVAAAPAGPSTAGPAQAEAAAARAPRRIFRLPSVLQSALPRLEELGVNTAMPRAGALMSRLPLPAVDSSAVRDLDHFSFGDLLRVVQQLEGGLVPSLVAVPEPEAGPPPKTSAQVLLEALVGHLKNANDGRRLAVALEPRLAACPAKVQLPGVGATGGEAGLCAGGQAAASVQAAGASPTMDRSACSSASQALQEAAGLTTAITAYSARGQGLAACGASAGTDSHFGGGAAGAAQPVAPPGPSPAPAVAPAHEPATPAWDEAQVQLLVEHYPIKLSFLRGLVL